MTWQQAQQQQELQKAKLQQQVSQQQSLRQHQEMRLLAAQVLGMEARTALSQFTWDFSRLRGPG
jgi:hypothetical protein